MIDLRRYQGHQGMSKGNLIKWEITNETNQKTFIKTGRASTRDYPFNFGIEPLVEVICYRYAELLGIPCAKQKLDIGHISHDSEDKLTLINTSHDFRSNKEFIEFGNSMSLTGAPIKRDFNTIATAFDCRKELLTMLLFDTLVLNEDRHDFNFGFIVHASGVDFAPLYDNGYSLLYDDLRGMKNNFHKASKFCNCNSFYLSFHNCDQIIRTNLQSYTLRELCNINVREDKVSNMINKIYTEYTDLISGYDITNFRVDKFWFERVSDFIIWRLHHVRSL